MTLLARRPPLPLDPATLLSQAMGYESAFEWLPARLSESWVGRPVTRPVGGRDLTGPECSAVACSGRTTIRTNTSVRLRFADVNLDDFRLVVGRRSRSRRTEGRQTDTGRSRTSQPTKTEGGSLHYLPWSMLPSHNTSLTQTSLGSWQSHHSMHPPSERRIHLLQGVKTSLLWRRDGRFDTGKPNGEQSIPLSAVLGRWKMKTPHCARPMQHPGHPWTWRRARRKHLLSSFRRDEKILVIICKGRGRSAGLFQKLQPPTPRDARSHSVKQGF